MKLEEGMYVRTKWGIAKIREVEIVEEILGREVQPITIYYVDRCFQPIDETKCFKEDIIKASHNIIDLIEAGDILKYVYYNKECVSKVLDRGSKMLLVTAHLEVSLGLVDIKSIVTKEQFESMSYKVGE